MGATGLKIRMQKHHGKARDSIYALILHVLIDDQNCGGRQLSLGKPKNNGKLSTKVVQRCSWPLIGNCDGSRGGGWSNSGLHVAAEGYNGQNGVSGGVGLEEDRSSKSRQKRKKLILWVARLVGGAGRSLLTQRGGREKGWTMRTVEEGAWSRGGTGGGRKREERGRKEKKWDFCFDFLVI